MSSIYKVGVLTISDRCSQGQAEDKSGPKLIQTVKEKLCDSNSQWVVVQQKIIPDESNCAVTLFILPCVYTTWAYC